MLYRVGGLLLFSTLSQNLGKFRKFLAYGFDVSMKTREKEKNSLIQLKDYGYKDCYLLDNERIYNTKTKKYLKQDKQGSFTLIREDGRPHHISANTLYKRVYGAFYSTDNIKDLPNEEWREIQGGKAYSISNYGRVKAHLNRETHLLEWDISTGYARVRIDIGYGAKNYLVHKLVAQYFLPTPKQAFCCIHHIDTNKLNNFYKNLMFVSVDEHNYIHKKINERKKELERLCEQEKNSNE